MAQSGGKICPPKTMSHDYRRCSRIGNSLFSLGHPLLKTLLAISFANFCSAPCWAYDASTYAQANAFDVESGDGDFQSFPKAASANYSNPNGGSASAFANQDPLIINDKFYLSLHAFATATGGSGDPGDFVANRASAYTSWDDDIRVTIPNNDIGGREFPSYLQFMYRMSGTSSGDAHGDFNFTTYDSSGDPIIQTRDPNAFDADFKDVPFLLNFSDNWDFASFQHITLSLHVIATGLGSGQPGPHTSTADYSHTVTLVSITPYDAAGNIVPGVTIDSTSGFDYNAVVVPEPSSLVLLGLAATFVAGRILSRRKKAAAST